MELTSIERECLKEFRGPAEERDTAARPAAGDHSVWLRFSLSALLEAGRAVRALRPSPMAPVAEFKADASPVTRQEHEIEQSIRERLARLHPDAVMVGEETGGTLPSNGIAVAVDPIDGTWALLNRTETCATSLAVFSDGQPFLGAVLNPATGEIAYALPDTGTRLLQLSAIGEDDRACDLPLDRVPPDSILVNVHPHRNAGPLVNVLNEAWSSGGINMVRAPGGSPAWALLEAAKGSFVYINLWSQRPADAFDLAAGIVLVREAGGDVTDLTGRPIPCEGHHGPFVAGVTADARKSVADVAARVCT